MGKIYAFHMLSGPPILGELVSELNPLHFNVKNAIQISMQQSRRVQGEVEMGFMPIGAPINSDIKAVPEVELSRSAVVYKYVMDDKFNGHKGLLDGYKQFFSQIMTPIRPTLQL